MKSEEKMREEFEAWWESAAVWKAAKLEAWLSWKASRESLVIRVNSAACHDATAGDVLDAIENSGIKWEVE